MAPRRRARTCRRPSPPLHEVGRDDDRHRRFQSQGRAAGRRRRACRHHRLRRAAGDRRHAQDELLVARHRAGGRHPVDGHRGQGLLGVADPGRLDLGGGLHARLPRHDPLRDDRHGGGHRRLDHRHGFLRGPRLQALPGQVQRRRPRPARSLHRPDLRHLYRRGGAAGLRPRDQGDHRRPGAAPLFLARVHLGDRQVAGSRQRQEARIADPDGL